MRVFSGLLAILLGLCSTSARAEPFVFHGALDDGAKPAEGTYALKLTLYRHEGDAAPLVGPTELLDVAVNEGRFAAGLEFGTLPQGVSEGWLEVAVKAKDEAGDYATLGGRTRVALKATEACPASWSLSGNALTNPAANFLGTTDAQPIEMRANNQRIARFESIPLTTGTTANVLLGSPGNVIDAGARGATIAGGGVPIGGVDPDVDSEGPNRVTDHYGTVGGGMDNVAGDSSGTLAESAYATVSGGVRNQALGSASAVGGGSENYAIGYASFVGGGNGNGAFGVASFSSGFLNAAYGDVAAVVSGTENLALGEAAAIVGGRSNCAGGTNSWAGGYGAKIRPRDGAFTGPACIGVAQSGDEDGDEGSFVWADSSAAGAPFTTTGPNQFAIRATGGLRVSDGTSQFFGSSVRQMLNLWGTQYGIGVQDSTFYSRTGTFFAWYRGGTHSDGPLANGGGDTLMYLDPSGNLFTAGGINPPSDRALKVAFESIDPSEILDRVLTLPIAEWSYKNTAAQRHIGPVAQDFHAAFGLNGEDDKHIATVDADGVALAAIQGLNAKLEAELAVLRGELAVLRAQVGDGKVVAHE